MPSNMNSAGTDVIFGNKLVGKAVKLLQYANVSQNIRSAAMFMPENRFSGICVKPEQPLNVLLNRLTAPPVIVLNKFCGIGSVTDGFVPKYVHPLNVPENIPSWAVVTLRNNPDGMDVIEDSANVPANIPIAEPFIFANKSAGMDVKPPSLKVLRNIPMVAFVTPLNKSAGYRISK